MCGFSVCWTRDMRVSMITCEVVLFLHFCFTATHVHLHRVRIVSGKNQIFFCVFPKLQIFELCGSCTKPSIVETH
jgi:hypothetical protein